jgi:flagellar protein FlbD
MVKLTKLNGQSFTLNAELIESLEEIGKNTRVSLATNNKYNVLESMAEVSEKVIEYRRRLNEGKAVVNPIQGFERD